MESFKIAPSLPQNKIWSTHENRMLSLFPDRIRLKDSFQTEIRVTIGGITVRSGGDLELDAGEMTAGYAGRRMQFTAGDISCRP